VCTSQYQLMLPPWRCLLGSSSGFENGGIFPKAEAILLDYVNILWATVKIARALLPGNILSNQGFCVLLTRKNIPKWLKLSFPAHKNIPVTEEGGIRIFIYLFIYLFMAISKLKTGRVWCFEKWDAGLFSLLITCPWGPPKYYYTLEIFCPVLFRN